MSGGTSFNEIWRGLVSKTTGGEERAHFYASLTGLLKGAANGTDPEAILTSLCQHHKSILRCILSDVKCESCDHSATQALGYFIHSAECAKKFSIEQVAATVNGLCDIISSAGTSRALCTRALWCLANQNFSSSQMVDHVTTIVNIVTEVLVSQQQATPTVDTEALNLFTRLSYQCEEEFMSQAHKWYKGMVARILFTRNVKLQKKALSFVREHADPLKANSELIHWLCVKLKENTVSVMLTQLSAKGVDYAHVLEIWAHFINIIGQALHRHGSFLNEMLRVVEMGFKHRSMVAQESAYSAWRQLISNFALDHNLLTSRKRLKLLLMPLLRSAVKERTGQVEEARLKTWWYLILALGPNRQALFTQVCIPFLLLCLGLDPKLDVSQLSSEMADLASKYHSNVSENAVSAKGKLFARIISTNNQLPVATPTLPMLLTGCHAIMQFTGNGEAVTGSLIQLVLFGGPTFPDGVVTMEVAWFLLLYLDGLSTYLTQHTSSGANLDSIIYYLFSLVGTTLMSMCEGSTPQPGGAEAHLLTSALHCLASGSWAELMTVGTRMRVLSNFAALSPQLLVGTQWKLLLSFVVTLAGGGHCVNVSDWLTTIWTKTVSLMPLTSDPLSNLLYLSDQLEMLARKSGEVIKRQGFILMWTTLAQRFSKCVTETTRINHGTALEPNFKAVVDILRFPLLFLLYKCDKNQVTDILEVWRTVYDMAVLNVSLVVGDPNHCSHLISSQLYSAYKDVAKDDTLSLETKLQTQKFDVYQNSITSIISIITSKIQWPTLTSLQGSEDRAKSIKKLLSLLAWQLARFCDGTKKSPVSLATLTTPYTLHQVILTFFRHLPTFDLLWAAVENLSEPLSGLWSALLHDHTPPTGKIRQKSGLLDEIVSTWLTVTTRLRCQGPSPFPSSLLPSLTPLLVTTLTSDLSKLVSVTLNFWALTFDTDDSLFYPAKLSEAFRKCFENTPCPHGLRLINLKGVAVGRASKSPRGMASVEDSMPVCSEDAVEMSETQANEDEVLVIPHNSPLKALQSPHRRMCSSFLGQGRAGYVSPHRPHPLSPGSKALDKVLSKHSSPGRKGTGVHRKLHMVMEEKDKESYVSIPAAKKPCLRTEHQQEKQLEHKDMPPLYNDLDDHTYQPVHEEGSMESPIIIPESEVPPEATPTTTPPSLPGIISTTAATAPTTVESPPTSVAAAPPLTTPTSCDPLLRSPPTLKSILTSGGCKTTPPLVRPPLRSVSMMSSSGDSVCKATARTVTLAETTPTTTTAPSAEATPSETTPVDTIPPLKSIATPTFIASSCVATHPLSTAPPSTAVQSCVETPSLTTPITMPTSSTPPLTSVTPPLSGVTPPFVSSPQPPLTSSCLTNTSNATPTSGACILTPPTSGTPLTSVPIATSQLPPVVIGPLLPGIQLSPGGASASMVTAHPGILGQMTLSNVVGYLSHAPTNVGGTPFSFSNSVSSSKAVVGTSQSNVGVSTSSGTMAVGTISDANKIVVTTVPGKVIIVTNSAVVSKTVVTASSSKNGTPASSDKAVTGTLARTGIVPSSYTMTTASATQHVSTQLVSSGQRGSVLSGEGATALLTSPAQAQKKRRNSEEGAVKKRICSAPLGEGVGVVIKKPRRRLRQKDKDKGQVSGTAARRGKGRGRGQRITGAGMEVGGVTEVGGVSTLTTNGTAERKIMTGEEDVVRIYPVLNEEKSVAAVCNGMDTSPSSTTPTVVQDPKTDSNSSSSVSPILEPTCSHGEDMEVLAQVVDVDEGEDPLKGCGHVAMETDRVQGDVELGDEQKGDAIGGKGMESDSTNNVSDFGTKVKNTEQGHTPQSCDTGAMGQRVGSVSGILKHVSQFDTPSSIKEGVTGRRVQFASKPHYKEAEVGKEVQKTPKQGRSLRLSQSFSSRRTLQMSHAPLPPNKTLLSKQPVFSDDSPVFPSLVNSTSPVDEILPALSPASKFTHGLLHLVRARHITTVGQISSLTEKQVQMLPIKSPKVLTLRSALHSFKLRENSLQGTAASRRRPSADEEGTAGGGLPAKWTKTAAQDKTVTMETKTTATPTCDEDSFMLESDPNMTSPTHTVTLATPGSQDSPDDVIQSSATVQHDHTYSSQTTPTSPTKSCDKDEVRGVVSVTESVVSVTKDVVCGKGGVVEAGSVLSQELFSEGEESDEQVCVANYLAKELDADGCVVSSTHHKDIAEENGKKPLDELEIESNMEVETVLESDKPVAMASGMEPEQEGMELELRTSGASETKSELQESKLDSAASVAVSSVAPPTGISVAPPTGTSAAPPTAGSATPHDLTVEQIIKFLPSCEVHVHRSTEVTSQQLHTLTDKLLNFIFTVNSKLKSFTS